MTLEIVSGASTIAMFSTILFLLIAATWQTLTSAWSGNNRFSNSIMFEAAQRFRDRFDALTRKQSEYLASSLVFLVIFATTALLGPDRLLSGLPAWQLITMVVVVSVAVLYGLYSLILVAMQRRKIEFLRDANIATGHSLQRLTSNQNRVFHDVPCTAGVIDNVIVGPHGMYSICVVAKRPGTDNRVRLNGDTLSFAPGNEVLSVSHCGMKATQLARELRKHTAHDIRVRPVIAVPGWEIDAQASDQFLVVNERNVSMLRGWKDQKDYLMNEDIEQIQKLLTERCTRYKQQ
jgi:hypothetical protein